MQNNRWAAALEASTFHLGLSIIVALLAAWVVLQIWFPFPYRILAGGQHLFWLLVGIDVVCGPLLTAVLFNPSKSRQELMLDLSLVALIQVAALGYGLYSIAQARPVVLAFETDRMAVVSAAQIELKDLEQAPAKFQSLSWTGPVLLGTRPPKDGAEMFDSVQLSLQGFSPALRPGWWQDYEVNRPLAKQRMKKLSDLHTTLSTELQATLDQAIKKTGISLSQLFYLPLVSQKVIDGWTVLLDSNANIVGYAAVDGF